MRQFKDRNLGELPGQLQSNLQILGGLQNQLASEQDALGRAKQQNAYYESLISQYKTVAATQPKAGQPNTVGLPALDQELDRLKAQLADLSSRYTDQHPDVRKVKEEIAETEKMRQQVLADMKAKAADPSNSTPEYASAKDMAPLMEVESQLKGNQIEIANRQRTIADLEGKINEYQARLNGAPVREEELADLTRDYDQSQKDYDSLLARRNQSELATNLNKSQEGEHFSMIDPPNLPTKPYSPDRFKLSLAGLFVGLVLGAGVTAGTEFVDDRVYRQEDFKKLLAVEVMAEIPPLPTPEEESRGRRRLVLESVLAGALSLITLAGVAFSFLRG